MAGLALRAPALLFVAIFVLIAALSVGRDLDRPTARCLAAASSLVSAITSRSGTTAGFWRALMFTFKYTLVLTPILMVLGLRAGAADGGQHAAETSRADHRFPARRHRAQQFEPLVVLAVRPAGRPFNKLMIDLHMIAATDRLVRQRRSRLLGGGDLHHLEGARLRHGAVRRQHPVDRSARSWRRPLSTAPATGRASRASSCL